MTSALSVFRTSNPNPELNPLFLSAYAELSQLELHLSACIDTAPMSELDDGWSDVFQVLFNFGEANLAYRVRDLFASIDRAFPEYYDPNSGYQDDVEAWMAAFREGLGCLRTEYIHRMQHRIRW